MNHSSDQTSFSGWPLRDPPWFLGWLDFDSGAGNSGLNGGGKKTLKSHEMEKLLRLRRKTSGGVPCLLNHTLLTCRAGGRDQYTKCHRRVRCSGDSSRAIRCGQSGRGPQLHSVPGSGSGLAQAMRCPVRFLAEPSTLHPGE